MKTWVAVALLFGAAAAVAEPPAPEDISKKLEATLLARFQETDRPRTDYAVLLASRYRHAKKERAAGRDVTQELAAILARCEDRAAARARPLEKVDWKDVPPLTDGGDLRGLARALAQAAGETGGGSVAFGTGHVRGPDLARGAKRLRALVESGADAAALDRAVRKEFDVYRSPGTFGTGEVLFTSYASPVYTGSLKRSEKYRYPIFRSPSSRGLSGKVSRKEIYAGALDGHGLEIAWFADRMDEYQIQIEGSGFVRLAEGGFLHITYAGANGRDYQSLGKAMVKDGLFRPWEIDNLAVRKYFREHPEAEQGYLERNPSFVYFDSRRINEMPEMPGLTGERSVAADRTVFARGQVGFVDTRAPEYSTDGELTGWHPWRRFIVAQDVGGAIKTAGRMDLYQGQGEEAQLLADTMKEPGALYLLVPHGSQVK